VGISWRETRDGKYISRADAPARHLCLTDRRDGVGFVLVPDLLLPQRSAAVALFEVFIIGQEGGEGGGGGTWRHSY